MTTTATTTATGTLLLFAAVVLSAAATIMRSADAFVVVIPPTRPYCSTTRIKQQQSSFTAPSMTTCTTNRLLPLNSLHMSADDDDDDDDDMDFDDEDYIDEDDDVDDFIDVEGDDYDDDDDDDDDDDEYEEDDSYTKVATSEFDNTDSTSSSSALTASTTAGSSGDGGSSALTTNTDWGGELDLLRNRMNDIENGISGKNNPSQTLFRMMSSDTPNQCIGKFVSNANPHVVQAMSGAINSLLGGLSNPNMGVEMVVKASGEKISSLCFQLQMTGYMFRNAEYVLALKDLMDLKGKQLTIDDYQKAFDKLDIDKSGYIEISEIRNLFQNAYGSNNDDDDDDDDDDVDDDDTSKSGSNNNKSDDDVPIYEITAFLEFFDKNEDGKISWEEFKKGLAANNNNNNAKAKNSTAKDEFANRLLASMEDHNDIDDDDGKEDEDDSIVENVSGTIQIEMDDGKIVKVDAKEYMESLKEEAQKLKLALRREKYGGSGSGEQNDNPTSGLSGVGGGIGENNKNDVVDIAGYIASRQGDVKSLTEGIKPEIVDTMKKLVDFVLEGGDDNSNSDGSANPKKKNLSDAERAEMEMELPGSALQQLALWQLVLGYRLREEEAKGDYVKLLEG